MLALLIALLSAIDALESVLDCVALLAMDELLVDELLSVDVLDIVELLLPLSVVAASPADEPPQDTKLSESANTPNNKLSFITLVQCTLFMWFMIGQWQV